MDIQTMEYKRCIVVKTSGRIDGSNAPQLRDALKQITDKDWYNIILDMSDVNFMASAGWWVLIDTQKTCKPKGGEIALVSVEKGIRDSLNLVGMSNYFSIFDDVTSAVGSF
jgi:anti-anti-sigma factor